MGEHVDGQIYSLDADNVIHNLGEEILFCSLHIE